MTYSCWGCGKEFGNVKSRAAHAASRPQCKQPAEVTRANELAGKERLRRSRGIKAMQTLETRFWSKVDASGGMESCWPWLGVRIPQGYGQLWLGRRHHPATRIALMLVGRPVPDGMVAMHTCDNPPCVNPAHLRVGTISDNVKDMVAKGRDRWSKGRAA